MALLARVRLLGWLLLGAVWLLACRSETERCALCGMKLDPTSAWRADLSLSDGSVRHFDSPRCALTAWRTGRFDAVSLRVLDYYDHTWKDGHQVLFVVGSDVPGPMGPDLVPVERARAQKFASDHLAGHPIELDTVTAAMMADLH
jgi:nitrous oxide reductase accessory protein NosL